MLTLVKPNTRIEGYMDEFNDFDILLDSLKEKNENAEKGILNKAREQLIRECAKGYVSKIKTLNLEAIKQRSASFFTKTLGFVT